MQQNSTEPEVAWDVPTEESAHPRRRRRGWLYGFLGTLALLVAAYVGGAYYLSTVVPSSAKVGGVDVGGTSPAEAERRVESAIAKLESQPVTVSVEEKSFELDPDRAGLRIDTDATLAGLTQFTLDPRALYEHISGTLERDFVLDVDQGALTKAIGAGAVSIDRDPVEGTVELAEGEVTIVEPVPGLAVDVPQTTEQVIAVWPTQREVEGVGGPVEPQTPASAFAAFKTDFADKALAGPLTVKIGEGSFEMPVEQVTSFLTVTVADGSITPSVDEEVLGPVLEEAGAEAGVLKDARDARVTFSGTQASVEPSQTGVDVTVEGQGEAVLTALTAQERALTLEPVITQPSLTTEKAQATLPKERISSFTSSYSPAPRARNIQVAARALNGTYVAPGGQFSLNQAIGRRTAERGYVQAGTIVNDRIVDNYGGGVSQVSTTVYNAAYFAGVEFNEYRAHSFYISRYPEGREATLDWNSIDNRWTNNTKGAILVRAWADDYSITVELWGTKTFDVETVKGPRRNVVQPREIRDDSQRCVTQYPQPGFDVTVTRIIKQNGREIKRENVNTHYDPQNKVTCTHPNAG